MKIRNGFVSNSSSSSFIISNENFSSVRELAIYMIKKKIEDENYDYDEDDALKDIEENYNYKYIKALNNIDENAPVSFPSCNYDTHIKKVGNVYLVNTCNNTDWDLYEYTTTLDEFSKDELIKMKKKYTSSSEESRQIDAILDRDYEFGSFDIDYYSLDTEVVGVETYDRCNVCDSKNENSYLWETKKYGKICLKCNPVYKRKDKLDKINNSLEE